MIGTRPVVYTNSQCVLRRLAAVLVEAGHGQQSAALLQQACKAVLGCMPLEQQPGDCAEFAALLGALARELCKCQVIH